MPLANSLVTRQVLGVDSLLCFLTTPMGRPLPLLGQPHTRPLPSRLSLCAFPESAHLRRTLFFFVSKTVQNRAKARRFRSKLVKTPPKPLKNDTFFRAARAPARLFLVLSLVVPRVNPSPATPPGVPDVTFGRPGTKKPMPGSAARHGLSR